MRNIRIDYQYDGSSFFGFQRQPNKRTVQGEIEKALIALTNGDINMVSSGRTDKGVHALEQVSNFVTESQIPLEKLKYALRRSLPKDILLIDMKEVDMDFHSRFSAIEREYKYLISWEKSPFTSKYKTFVNYEIDPIEFLEIILPLKGRHDFNNFRLKDCAALSSVREIYELKTKLLDEKTLEVRIRANSFLKSQIRIIMGTALEIYVGNLNRSIINDMLKKPQIEFKKNLSEPEGLYLSKIIYEE